MPDTAPPIFSNYRRDLPAEVARVAVFIVAIGPAEDHRPAHEKTVAGCEGVSCALGGLPAAEGGPNGTLRNSPDARPPEGSDFFDEDEAA
jgi:hypothetical protein